MTKTLMQPIHRKALAIKDTLLKHRRQLHQYPERSLREENTSLYCQSVLKALGYQITPCWGHGFIADLTIAAAKTRLAFRADMDALPIAEDSNHSFSSQNQGVSHACGHDSHMSIALGTAQLLAEQQQELKTHVRFIFQPCEEMIPGGALGMIEKGCLQDVDEVYGLHNNPGTPTGQIKTRVGHLMAISDRFALTVHGRGCHAARPQDGLDPIVVAAELISSWQRIIARSIDPNHAAVLSVGSLHAGTTFNVIPDEVHIQGTVRTFDQGDRQIIIDAMQASLTAYQAIGYNFSFEHIPGYDAVINHALGVARISTAANAILGQENVDANCEPQGWGEDFAYYLQHLPGAFYFLGSGHPERSDNAPLHSPRFDLDENCLVLGVAIMSQLALDFGVIE